MTNQGCRMGRGNRACIESMEFESSKWNSQLLLALCKLSLFTVDRGHHLQNVIL